MENQQRRLKEPDYPGIEMVDLRNQNYPTRQTSIFPGSAKMQSTPCHESNGEDDGRRVTRNSQQIQVASEENRHEVSPERERCTSEITASGRGTSEHNTTSEEPIIAFQSDAIDIQDVNEEGRHDVEVTEDENYFLEKYELQFKRSNERGSRRYPSKRDLTQKFTRSSTRMSNRGVKTQFPSPREYIEVDDEYWRRDTMLRNSYVREDAHEESSLVEGMIEAQHQWYRSREVRSEEVTQINFWLVILALILTILTTVLLIMLWKYLAFNRYGDTTYTSQLKYFCLDFNSITYF